MTTPGPEEVRVERDGRAMTITLDRPADQNRLTHDVLLMLQGLVDRLGSDEEVQAIVITALNGTTRAGAAELALACDIRLAARHATFALPEALWGGFPGAGGPVRLPGIVGRARALELICTGREVDAAEMERLGLVLGVYPAAKLLPEARALAGRICISGPIATRGAKRIINVRNAAGFAAARALADALRHALEWSHDVDEGMAAHRENRAPKFTGR